MLRGKKGGKDYFFLEIPFGMDSSPVRKKVDLQIVLCCMLYLKSIYHKKVTRESLE